VKDNSSGDGRKESGRRKLDDEARLVDAALVTSEPQHFAHRSESDENLIEAEANLLEAEASEEETARALRIELQEARKTEHFEVSSFGKKLQEAERQSSVLAPRAQQLEQQVCSADFAVQELQAEHNALRAQHQELLHAAESSEGAAVRTLREELEDGRRTELLAVKSLAEKLQEADRSRARISSREMEQQLKCSLLTRQALTSESAESLVLEAERQRFRAERDELLKTEVRLKE
jgi:hypothetical protein